MGQSKTMQALQGDAAELLASGRTPEQIVRSLSVRHGLPPEVINRVIQSLGMEPAQENTQRRGGVSGEQMALGNLSKGQRTYVSQPVVRDDGSIDKVDPRGYENDIAPNESTHVYEKQPAVLEREFPGYSALRQRTEEDPYEYQPEVSEQRGPQTRPFNGRVQQRSLNGKKYR